MVHKPTHLVVGKTMFIVACVGLVFNLIMVKILHSGDQHMHGAGHQCSGHHEGEEEHSHGHGHSHGHDT